MRFNNPIENYLTCTAKVNFGFFLFYHNVIWDMILKGDPEFNCHRKINVWEILCIYSHSRNKLYSTDLCTCPKLTFLRIESMIVSTFRAFVILTKFTTEKEKALGTKLYLMYNNAIYRPTSEISTAYRNKRGFTHKSLANLSWPTRGSCWSD